MAIYHHSVEKALLGLAYRNFPITVLCLGFQQPFSRFNSILFGHIGLIYTLHIFFRSRDFSPVKMSHSMGLLE